MSDERLLELARHGDGAAFDALVAPHRPLVERVLRRMIGDREDAADLVQETLVRAYTRFGTFRGEAKLSTWLCAIATRLAIDHLAARRLEGDAKLKLREHVHARHGEELSRFLAESRFDVREHIAFCFGCVSRSLPAEEQAALVLRDVLELSNDEAAEIAGVTTSVLRHRLAAARTAMQERYEGLCRLVSKTGACWQCEGLRGGFREQGPEVPAIAGATPEEAWEKRLAVVRGADLDGGPARAFHDFLWRALGETP